MRGRALLVVSLIMVALNLRPALSSVAPVLPEIMRDTGLSAAGAGLLTTAPVLCLGLFGPLAPVISRWMRSERVVFLFLAVLAVGLLVRGFGTVAALLIGSGLIGIAIGIVNVLLPVLIKKDFSGSPALMTGVYTMALSTGAALASGLTVPLSKLMDSSWPAALAAWVVPVLGAMAVWVPRLKGASEASLESRVGLRGIWTNALAWQVTLFMGLQSALAYAVFGWLAPILRDRGMNDISAGALVSVSIIAQVVAALVTPVLATRGRDQRPAVVICMVLNMAGLLGCVLGPLSVALLWAVILGLGQGASFALALTLIVLRSADARTAGQLSSMAQGVG
jgi:CP family cyanate transporter-like MFS transporter